MKARVKATDKVVEVKSRSFNSVRGGYILKYVDQNTGVTYFEEELLFPKDLEDDLDYWTKLEHQYAGMAMQGMLSNPSIDIEDSCNAVVTIAQKYSHALVEKMKEDTE